MKTVYDWITVMIFAGLVTHFLHQSSKPGGSDQSIWLYMVACVGLAVANWLGNNDWHLAAIALIAATLGYSFYFFGPRAQPPQDH
jgi:ABC-type sugar transport system permease subunit